jgi:hypothetical protein
VLDSQHRCDVRHPQPFTLAPETPRRCGSTGALVDIVVMSEGGTKQQNKSQSIFEFIRYQFQVEITDKMKKGILSGAKGKKRLKHFSHTLTLATIERNRPSSEP